MVTKTCEFCHETKEYKNGQSFGGHKSMCVKRSNIQNIKDKISLTKQKPRNLYYFKCKKCGVEFTKLLLESEYKSPKCSTHCSKRCSNSRKHSEQTKQNISLGVRMSEKIERYYCNLKRAIPIVKLKRGSEEYKNVLSLKMKERYKNNPELHPNRRCAGLKESYPERSLREYFELKGFIKNVDFISQFHYDRYYIDFFIPKLNLCIEVDGERWHDKNSLKEIERENLIKEKYDLIRFEAKRLIKKEYQTVLDDIILKVNV